MSTPSISLVASASPVADLALVLALISRWVNWGPFADLSALLRFVEEGRADKTVVLFAVIDISSGQERFAGLLNLYQCSLSTLVSLCRRSIFRPRLGWRLIG